MSCYFFGVISIRGILLSGEKYKLVGKLGVWMVIVRLYCFCLIFLIDNVGLFVIKWIFISGCCCLNCCKMVGKWFWLVVIE